MSYGGTPEADRLRATLDPPTIPGAICGGARYVWETEADPKLRWCFGERKHLTGTWELRSENPRDITGIPIEQLSWWEPIWTYRCDGCGKDRRSGGFYLEGYG